MYFYIIVEIMRIIYEYYNLFLVLVFELLDIVVDLVKK